METNQNPRKFIFKMLFVVCILFVVTMSGTVFASEVSGENSVKENKSVIQPALPSVETMDRMKAIKSRIFELDQELAKLHKELNQLNMQLPKVPEPPKHQDEQRDILTCMALHYPEHPPRVKPALPKL
jgi:predicted transcriptional regulator